jgi:hypothetical protein
MMHQVAHRKAGALVGILFLCVFVFTPFTHHLTVQRAEADLPVIDPTNVVQNTATAISTGSSAASNITTAVQSSALVVKEYSLDVIGWALVNMLLGQMIQSVTQWVNSGFEGSPAFVTDLKGFLLNIADKVAGDYIFNSEALSFLCSPFELDIKLALQLQYQTSRANDGVGTPSACTLTGAMENVENFFNGDFLDGGWDRWYEVTMNPSNNPMGALIGAKIGLDISLENEKERSVKELDFGNGFLSFKNADGTITTPGNVIQTQLNNSLGLPGDRLAVADELNELIGALLGQLMGSLFSSGGLRGLTDSSYSANGTQSYFEAAAAAEDASGGGAVVNTAMQDTLDLETKYRALEQSVVDRITGAESFCEAATGEPLTASLTSKRSAALLEIVEAQTIIQKTTVFSDDLAALKDPDTAAPTLNALLTKYSATTVSEAESHLIQDFLTYKTSSGVHTQADIMHLELVVLQDPGSNASVWSMYPESVIAEIYIFQNSAQCRSITTRNIRN